MAIMVLSSWYASAQHPILSSFSFNNTDEGIALSFVIAGGNTCNGIDIFHKIGDTGTFKMAGQIPGICGHSSNDTRYDYLHESPNAFDTNYYYLDFGGVGPSEPVKIFYVPFKGAEMVVAQSGQTISVFIQGNSFSAAEIDIFDLQGKRVAYTTAREGQAVFYLPNRKGEFLLVHARNSENQVLVQKTLMIR